MHKPKRRTGEDGLIVESVVFRPQLLPTREHLLLGIGKLLPKSWKGFILPRDLFVPIGSPICTRCRKRLALVPEEEPKVEDHDEYEMEVPGDTSNDTCVFEKSEELHDT